MGDDRYESSGRKPDPIDMHVAGRVRLRRIVVGLSQEKLGERMGLTFQQIQKYEKGTNRIVASRLFQLSHILSVPIDFFFEEAPMIDRMSAANANPGFAQPKQEAYVMDFLGTRDGLELNRAFVKITDPKVRRRVVDLVRAMAGDVEPPLANGNGTAAAPVADRYELS